ncbi:amidophosphoribosyltransferase [filamentous cyanobacterium CCP5]|nr:amidophosphoribosyltransferase [filamentous cyanobacterium CCP5]
MPSSPEFLAAQGSPEPQDQLEPRPDKPEEACGVFGIFAPQEDVATLTYFGLYALQHRGQESAGIATFDQGKPQCYKEMGLVSQVFTDASLHALSGQMAIGHTRYSTTGASRVCNAQPFLADTPSGAIALAHNGNLVNASDLRDALIERDHALETTTDSEMIAFAIAEAVGDGYGWVEAAIRAFKRCQGAFSLTIGTPGGLMGARDPLGIRPLVIGTIGEPTEGQPTQYVLASETCALDIIGADYLRDVQPGELVWINEQGLTSIQWAEAAQRRLCVFEMIYFSRPDSMVNAETLYSYRQRLGRRLAQESPADVDLIMAVPDSGVPAAIGFSQESGIPYAEGLIKNRYVGRTFIQPTQSMRETGIRMKLNPLKDVLQGKRILIVDDSIVRGTTSRKIVKALREAGATEVHMRISSPPVTHPCFFGIDTDTQDQLIAASHSPAEIEQQIGVDSLAYLSWEGMLEPTQQDPNSFCSACFTGDYPLDIPAPIKRTKLKFEGNREKSAVSAG